MPVFTYHAGSDGSGGFAPPGDPRQLHVHPLGALGLCEYGGVRIHGSPTNAGSPADLVPGTYTLAGLGGLLDSPEVRLTLTERAEEHGAFMSGAFYSARTITVEGFILTDYLDQMWPALDLLKQAWRLQRDLQRIDFLLPGWAERRFCFGRPAGPLAIASPGGGSESRKPYRDFQAVFTAGDPRLYGATLLGSNHPFGNTQQPQQNAGNFDSPVRWHVTGPATNPELLDDSRGRAIRYVGAIASGQTLTVDTRERTATMTGVGNVYKNLSRFDDISIPPGGINLRGVAAAGSTGTWQAEHRDVWV